MRVQVTNHDSKRTEADDSQTPTQTHGYPHKTPSNHFVSIHHTQRMAAKRLVIEGLSFLGTAGFREPQEVVQYSMARKIFHAAHGARDKLCHCLQKISIPRA